MTRVFLAVAAAAVLGGCRGAAPIVGRPAAPAPETERAAEAAIAQPPPIPADANVLLTVTEAVAAPEHDLPAYVKVFVDQKPAGQTAIGPKSAPKSWGAVLEPGNHLFRFEGWMLPLPGEWTPLAVQWQPPERFIRVEAGRRTLVSLKFIDGGRRSSIQVWREP
jgi:hypothetical protein